MSDPYTVEFLDAAPIQGYVIISSFSATYHNPEFGPDALYCYAVAKAEAVGHHPLTWHDPIGEDDRYTIKDTHLTLRPGGEMTWEKWYWSLRAMKVGVTSIRHGFDFSVLELEDGQNRTIAMGSLRVGSEP